MVLIYYNLCNFLMTAAVECHRISLVETICVKLFTVSRNL